MKKKIENRSRIGFIEIFIERCGENERRRRLPRNREKNGDENDGSERKSEKESISRRRRFLREELRIEDRKRGTDEEVGERVE